MFFFFFSEKSGEDFGEMFLSGFGAIDFGFCAYVLWLMSSTLLGSSGAALKTKSDVLDPVWK